MRPINTTLAIAGLTLTTALIAFASSAESSITPDAAWKTLAAGNHRYVAGHSIRPDQSVAHRAELAAGQHPIAIVLSCSDSRVPPELVFDQGLGDLFVVRVAGNIVDDNALGSIEYAVEHLGASLIVVMGHEKCGAVSAAVKSAHADGHVNALVQAIQPAVTAAHNEKGDLVDNAVRENVKYVVGELTASEPIIAKYVHEGKVKIVGTRYDLDSGQVDLVK